MTRSRRLAAWAAAALLIVQASAVVRAEPATKPSDAESTLAGRASQLAAAATRPAATAVSVSKPAEVKPAESTDKPDAPSAKPEMPAKPESPAKPEASTPKEPPAAAADQPKSEPKPAEPAVAADKPATKPAEVASDKPEPATKPAETAAAEKPATKPADPVAAAEKPDAATKPAEAAVVTPAATRPAEAAAPPAVPPDAKTVETKAPAAEAKKGDEKPAEAKPASANPDMSAVSRLWYAQGHTHPILVHFPIGLLFAGALAVALRPFARKVTANVVYYCLLVGAASSVLSTLAGWAWAPQLKPGWDAWAGQVVVSPDMKWAGVGLLAAGILGVGLLVLVGGKGPLQRRPRLRSSWLQSSAFVATVGLCAAVLGIAGESRADVAVVGVTGEYSPFFMHRWSGVLMTVASVAVLVWATLTLRRAGAAQWPWQAAVILLAMGMGWVGHEGGELVYPENGDKILGIAADKRKVKIERESVTAPPKPAAKPAVASAGGGPKPPAAPATTGPAGTTKPATVASADVPPAGDVISFKATIDPIFVAKCYYCHNAEEKKGDFRMHTREDALKGGSGGEPLYVEGKSGESALIKHVTVGEHNEDFALMPPKKEKKPVTDEEVEILKKWIDQGAKWDN